MNSNHPLRHTALVPPGPHGRIYPTKAARKTRLRRFWRAVWPFLRFLLTAVLVGVGVGVALVVAFALAVLFLLVQGS